MRRFVWSLVPFVSLLATLAFAEDKPAPPLPNPPVPQFGTWTVVERAGERVHMLRLDGGWLLLHRGNTILGRAGREKDAYLGVMREPAKGAERTWFVRITAIAGNTLRAEIRDGWEATTARTETWVPQSGDTSLFGGPAVQSAGEAKGERNPAFGEYVYVDQLPELLSRVAPSYPEDARRAGVEGTVMVQALVGRDGRVHDTRVVKSIPMLDAAAVQAVRQWVFVPAQEKGKPVAVWVAAPVKFALK